VFFLFFYLFACDLFIYFIHSLDYLDQY